MVQATELDPACSECANNLGVLRIRQSKALEAEELLRTALTLNDKNPEPYFNLGVLYEINGDVGNAINSYREFTKRSLDTKSVEFLQVENRILTLTGK